MFRIVRLSTFLAWCGATALCGTALLLASFYLYLAPTLPSAEKLKTTQLQTPLRIYTADNKKIAEFGEKRRTPVSMDEVPDTFINAFIAAEDNRFFEHGGIDFKGLARATGQLISTGQIVSGGSTITMQVAKNFFLSRERTFIRKFNEIFLALQIENALSKNDILELYLNKIYLGNRAYGIHAAAQVYYGKQIDQLSIAEMAMIAGLPKAPSRYNPLANAERALIRRNWILDRMSELGMITGEQYATAINAPITAIYHGGSVDLAAPYLAEMARLETIQRFGNEAYTSGLSVYLTIHSEHQAAANRAVKSGLDNYDKRHGYRGPINQLSEEQLANTSFVKDLLRNTKVASQHRAAVITKIEPELATVVFGNGETGHLKLEDAKWAAPFITVNRVGNAPESLLDAFNIGDVIELSEETDGTGVKRWALAQTPEVQGALVSLSPKDGAIQALVGGYDFKLSHYNRATQAKRQPGSNFKPFIYLAALEHGNTAATLINDAPIVFDDKNLEAVWRPENSSGKFYGPTRLRQALYNSRNLVSIRLLKRLGIKKAVSVIRKFGFDPNSLPKDLSLALGSAGITPMEIAAGYSMLANGGHYIEPYLVARIENSFGEVIYRANPYTVCDPCELETTEDSKQDQNPRPAPRIANQQAMYILHSMLKDVITKGTGRRALVLKRDDLAGKTGTTNDQKDAWFSGFNTELQTSVWVGFDNPRTLGRREYGARAALPIWIDYMKVALQGKESAHMARPEGIITARINPKTGNLAQPGDSGAIFELFRREYAPSILSTPYERDSQNNENKPALAPEDIF